MDGCNAPKQFTHKFSVGKLKFGVLHDVNSVVSSLRHKRTHLRSVIPCIEHDVMFYGIERKH